MLSMEIWELVRAGFSGVWVETQEAAEAILELTQLARERDLVLLRWNLDIGLVGVTGDAAVEAVRDPVSAIRSLQSLTDEHSTLLIVENVHRFLDSPEICQVLQTQLLLGKQFGRHIIVLSPVLKLPPELERQFVVLRHPLPTKEQLREIAESLVTGDDAGLADDAASQLIDAASGLTRAEAESAFSLSLVRHGRLAADAIWELKAQWLRKSGLLSMYRSETGFETLGGLSNLKQFCLKSLRPRDSTESNALPRGVLMLGVPGTGKSAFAKALGRETGRPVLCMDVGQLMGSLVGQTEQNIRQALQTADAMQPAILFIDECEKMLAGVSSGGRGDSGVSSRLFGTLLSWLGDHASDVYTIMTCNNLQQLPPEFSRAERFDAIMFLDLPGRAEKDSIWKIYRSEFRIGDGQLAPPDDLWTGAEIKACCRLSVLLDISLQEAAQYIVPVGVTAAEGVDRLRGWATGRCLDASRPGVYRRSDVGAPAAARTTRRVRGYRPSDN